MTMQMIIGGEYTFDFATINGMKDFRLWVDELSTDDFPALSHLVDWGWVNELDVLHAEILNAIKQLTPIVSLRPTLANFVSQLARRGGAESIMITNGLSE